MWMIVLRVLCLISFISQTCSQKSITIGLIVPNNDKYEASLHRVLPVVRLAIQRVQESRDLFLPGWNINVTWTELSDCSSTYGPLSAIDMRDKVQVFFGPVCVYDLAPVVRYTNASWGIPVLTSSGRNTVYDNKTEYSLMTRMNGFYGQLGDVMLQIFRKFSWVTVGMFYSDYLMQKTLGHSDCFFAMEAYYYVLKTQNHWTSKKPHQITIDEFEEIPETKFQEHLESMSENARIITVCTPPKSLRRLLLTAKKMGLLDSGEYVFLNVELTASTNTSQRAWHDPTDTDANNTMAKKAFESVLTVRPRTPDAEQYRIFSHKVRELAESEFGYYAREEQVNPEAASFYEAVVLYVTALKDALRRGKTPADGRLIYQLMRNRTLPGVVGNFTVDMNNDRHVDYSILDMDPITGMLKEVATYWGTEKKYVDKPDASIHWPGGKPPSDEPECGFDGAKCQPFLSTASIVAIVLSVLLILVGTMALLGFRHYKKEAELATMSWLLKYDDLQFGSQNQLKRSDSRQSLLKLRDDVSVDTLALGEGRKQIFAPTAYYKKQRCAVKKLTQQQIVVSRPLLKEFKVIQSLQHDHVTRFIGACFDSEPPCILFEYCPKGSLEDILENESIQLDWMFRYSLMHDLMKGMAYIHSSELKTHGNLKSSNCVVDSRFVLKITDYGPHCMRFAEDEELDSHAYWKRKLWTAPELLRLHRPPPSGTQKGDVYSFAIIAQEIVYRNGPFYVEPELEPKGIIRRVIEVHPTAFRPILEPSAADESLVAMIEKAWSEDPNVRPDFTQLRALIRRLNRDNESGTLLDNLLRRMEMYANNLETLVAERTADYMEQKDKAEGLLYQLLPAPVATQLIKGQSVKAEHYDSVTIYFSDIVGFTTISATSTPMQVVDFLNDLYTCFDSITEDFDVYKVETIGDAYVVVSGLPVRNGDSHAKEIGKMSLAIIDKVQEFKIRHRPDEKLRVRIGMHTGPCVAGVVGLKMPRYCLFGDTVNTASRMESNSLPLKIHCSEAAHDVLDKFGIFDMERRGELDVKGKGKMITYWLEGCHEVPEEKVPPLKPLPAPAPMPDIRRIASLGTVPAIVAPVLPSSPPQISAMLPLSLFTSKESAGDAPPEFIVPNGVNKTLSLPGDRLVSPTDAE